LNVSIGSVVFDCADPESLAEFWRKVTGYEHRHKDEEWVSLRDPAGHGPHLGFQKVPEPKAVKNRVHLDLYVDDEQQTADQIMSMGATYAWSSTDPEDIFIVLRDPEGNEFCVVRRSSLVDARQGQP
jgi:predicted enzyme related to lactoylglutathione lyase